MPPSRIIALGLMLFGLLLHTFTWTVKSSEFSVAFWLLSLSPYIAGAVLYFAFRKRHAGAGALILPAILDVFTYYSVFINSHGSMVGLALIFVPVLNVLLLMPIGAGVGWWAGRRIATSSDMLSNKSLERTRDR